MTEEEQSKLPKAFLDLVRPDLEFDEDIVTISGLDGTYKLEYIEYELEGLLTSIRGQILFRKEKGGE